MWIKKLMVIDLHNLAFSQKYKNDTLNAIKFQHHDCLSTISTSNMSLLQRTFRATYTQAHIIGFLSFTQPGVWSAIAGLVCILFMISKNPIINHVLGRWWATNSHNCKHSKCHLIRYYVCAITTLCNFS